MKQGKNNYFQLIVTGVAIALLLRIFVFDVQKVSGDSMVPFANEGETVYIFKLAYGLENPFSKSLLIQWASPEEDDVVSFYMNGRLVMKRCVATENTPLDFSKDSGYILSAGNKEIPLTEPQYQRLKYSSSVPEGTILAVGDNYQVSVDSRDYGFVDTDCILGKVIWR